LSSVYYTEHLLCVQQDGRDAGLSVAVEACFLFALMYAIDCVNCLQSFKRRFFYLKQQADSSYVLEFHKDEKRMEAKGAIFLDSAVDVRKVCSQFFSVQPVVFSFAIVVY